MAATDTAADVVWDLSDLLGGRSVDQLLDEATARADGLTRYRGRVAETVILEPIPFELSQSLRLPPFLPLLPRGRRGPG